MTDGSPVSIIWLFNASATSGNVEHEYVYPNFHKVISKCHGSGFKWDRRMNGNMASSCTKSFFLAMSDGFPQR